MNNQLSKWTDFHSNKIQENYPQWPVEIMLKSIFGQYLGIQYNTNSGNSVLDVGCGFSNNLIPFFTKGMNCHGIEITKEIVDTSKKSLKDRSIEGIDIQVGNNKSIPYKNNNFDLIISNNAIHYESNESDYLKAIQEYARVLKPNGQAFIMTVAPEHEIFKNSKYLGSNTRADASSLNYSS